MQTRKKSKKAKKRQLIIRSAYAVIIILAVFVVFLLLLPSQEASTPAKSDPTEQVLTIFTPKPKIPKDMIISGIDVGGMTEEKATQVLTKALPHTFMDQNMVISYSGKTLELTPEVTQVHWDIAAAVEKAMKGASNEIQAALVVDKTEIRNQLNAFFRNFGGIYSPSGYWLEGSSPNLNNKSGECQTLILVPGSRGLPIDIDELISKIITSYKESKFSIELEDAGEVQEPKELNLDEIYNQVIVEPVNPDLNRKTLEIIPGKFGFAFDKDSAAKALKEAMPGEVIRIPMLFTDPTLPIDEVWFLDTLGYCKTEYTDNEDRNENLRLACSKLNGVILQPDEVLSYNQTLGERTREAGYKPAPAYSGVDLVNEIGGGICQVSSTLYLSSLFAELGIVERKNHGFPANYIPLGLDATVNWGTTDLKIRNDYELPVKILAELEDGFVKVKIMGVDQRDHYVKMEYRVDDHPSYAAAYKCLYDKETDEEISRSLNHTSIYLEDVWCWPGHIQSATDDE